MIEKQRISDKSIRRKKALKDVVRKKIVENGARSVKITPEKKREGREKC